MEILLELLNELKGDVEYHLSYFLRNHEEGMRFFQDKRWHYCPQVELENGILNSLLQNGNKYSRFKVYFEELKYPQTTPKIHAFLEDFILQYP